MCGCGCVCVSVSVRLCVCALCLCTVSVVVLALASVSVSGSVYCVCVCASGHHRTPCYTQLARIKRAPIGGHLSFRSAADFWCLDLLNSEGDCPFARSGSYVWSGGSLLAPLVCQCKRCSWHGQLDTQLSRQCSPLVSALKRFPHCWRFGSRKPIA